MKKTSTQSFPMIALLILLSSCDPVYNISIKNSTEDTIIVSGVYDFNNENQMTLDGSYKIQPNKSIIIGQAIAEIDNDIPTDSLIIQTQTKLIKALGEDQVKELFEKNIFGSIKTPYIIDVE